MDLTRRTAVVVTAVAVAVIVVAVCVTVLLLALHGDDPAPTAAAPPTTSPAEDRPTSRPTATTQPTLSTRTPPQPGDQVMDVSPEADAGYLATLSAAGLLTPGTDEQEVIEVGRLGCAFLATGQGDVYDAAVVVYQSGQATASEAGTIVGAAVGAYCPQYGDQP
jgi:hypothetical protein